MAYDPLIHSTDLREYTLHLTIETPHSFNGTRKVSVSATFPLANTKRQFSDIMNVLFTCFVYPSLCKPDSDCGGEIPTHMKLTGINAQGAEEWIYEGPTGFASEAQAKAMNERAASGATVQ